MNSGKTSAGKRRFFMSAIKVSAGMFCLLLLGGCTSYKIETSNIESVEFHANLKANNFANYGKRAAYYDGRIYYLASELGTPGIYSMDPTGENEKLEVAAKDIRAINIQPDGIYYSGYVGTAENSFGPYRQFHLFFRRNGETNGMDYLESIGYSKDSLDNNVWDFHISGNGNVVICYLDNNNHMGIRMLYLESIRGDKAAHLSDYANMYENTKVTLASFNRERLELAKIDNLFFLADFSDETSYRPDATMFSGCSLIEVDSGRYKVMNMIDRNPGYNDGTSFNRGFCRGNSDGFILASVHGLEKYEFATKTVSSIVAFEKPESVFATIDCWDDILIFTQIFRKNFDLDYYYHDILKRARAVAESLYRIDPATGEKQHLLTLDYKNAFLYADASTVVTGGGTTVSIYDISGDKAVLQRTIEVEHNIVDCDNKADTAGGWLFLYRFNENTQRDELIEKVYIGS